MRKNKSKPHSQDGIQGGLGRFGLARVPRIGTAENILIA